MWGPILRGDHQQGAVQQFVHVGDLVGRAVELRVLLGGGDEGRDAGGRLLDLVHQQFGLDGVVEPPHGTFEGVARPRPRRSGPAIRCRGRPVRRSARAAMPSAMPWSSSQSERVSSRSEASSGLRVVALATRSAVRSWTSMSVSRLSRRYGRCRDDAELVAHAGDTLTERGRGAHGRGGRVVQLMGQPCGQRPERQEPFSLADGLLGALGAEEEAFQQVHRHRETTRA